MKKLIHQLAVYLGNWGLEIGDWSYPPPPTPHPLLSAIICSLLLLTPITTFADDTCVDGVDSAADALLGTDNDFLTIIPPISNHYTRPVLERAQRGIELADGTEFFWLHTFLDISYLSWATHAMSAVASVVQSPAHFEERSLDLHETTICLHVDLTLLEAMMDRVRCKLEYALENKEIARIFSLRLVATYLGERYEHLREGATDHTYEDTDWWQWRGFDSLLSDNAWCCEDAGEQCIEKPVWHCDGPTYISLDGCLDGSFCEPPTQDDIDNGAEEPRDIKMCPFDTDYLSPSTVADGPYASDSIGYGCDLTVLDRLRGSTVDGWALDEIIMDEYLRTSAIIAQKDAFISIAERMKDDAIAINSWLGLDLHPRIAQFGITSNDRRIHHTATGCLLSGSLLKLDAAAWPDGAAKSAVRGPFSIDKNEEGIVHDALDVRTLWGERRPFPLYLSYPDELDDDDDQEAARERLEGVKELLLNDEIEGRKQLRREVVAQERNEARILAKAVDAPKRLMNIYAPLREKMFHLAELSSDLRDGVRGFARSFAWFLRRSCIDRPCNERLERILKIVFQDECFPYTDGNFDDETTHEKCRDAAQ